MNDHTDDALAAFDEGSPLAVGLIWLPRIIAASLLALASAWVLA